MSSKKKVKKSPLKVAGYVVGSIAVAAVASVVIPEFINKGASCYYKNTNKGLENFDDNKYVIVRKNTNKGI
ncbi:hypothetical protein [Ruminococcus albus]|uniref:hypothetical protein n=1 Tax=Ruminococcus albus TaxID=1264 RepID=UPI00056750DF|nr:hypothetical protein [Ruminococcus albus]MCC3350775.1 hypothetical protein [Ruminococcus albus 8]